MYIGRAVINAPVPVSRFEGAGLEKVGFVAAIDSEAAPALLVDDVIVHIDSRYFRPAEVETLLRYPSEAKSKLGWITEITV